MDRHQMNEARKLANALHVLVQRTRNAAAIVASSKLCNYLIDAEDKMLSDVEASNIEEL